MVPELLSIRTGWVTLIVIYNAVFSFFQVRSTLPVSGFGNPFVISRYNHMQTSNVELMRGARESLKGKWGLAIAVTVVYCVLLSVPQSVKNVGPIISILFAGPLAGGLALFSLSLARNQEAKFEQLFDGFKVYATYLVAHVLMTIFILLWLLLLIIPGIIAAFSYAMTYYVIADNPSISASDALRRSKELMNGNKGKYACLLLRFIGWGILAIFTAGIGLLWLVPYIQVSTAKFYEDIKGEVVKSTAEAEPKKGDADSPIVPIPDVLTNQAIASSDAEINQETGETEKVVGDLPKND